MAVTLDAGSFNPVAPHGLLAPTRREDGTVDIPVGGAVRAEVLGYYEGVMPKAELLEQCIEQIRKFLGAGYESAPAEICNRAANALASAYWASAGKGGMPGLFMKCGAQAMLSPYRPAPVEEPA